MQQNLDRVQVGVVEDGTAIGSAIATGVNRLRDQPGKSKVIILLNDGQNNIGKIMPETDAQAAQALGVKIYTIGAGVKGEAPVPVTDAFGNKRLAMGLQAGGDDYLTKPFSFSELLARVQALIRRSTHTITRRLSVVAG